MQTKNYHRHVVSIFKNLLLALFFSITSVVALKAQSSKLGGLLYKGAVINNQVKSVTSQADSTKSTVIKLGNLFGKKNKKNSDKEVTTKTDTTAVVVTKPDIQSPTNVAFNRTVITITGIDFLTLQTLSENIEGCEGVKNTVIKFSPNLSVVTVEHTGTSVDLLTAMQKTSKPIIAAKNVQGFEEGKIDVKL